MLLNAAKCQGYNFYCFWVIKGRPTERGGSKTTSQPRLMLTISFYLVHCYWKSPDKLKKTYWSHHQYFMSDYSKELWLNLTKNIHMKKYYISSNFIFLLNFYFLFLIIVQHSLTQNKYNNKYI